MNNRRRHERRMTQESLDEIKEISKEIDLFNRTKRGRFLVKIVSEIQSRAQSGLSI